MIRIYGCSDDLVEVEVEGAGGGACEEYGGNTRLIFGTKDFGGVKVDMTYVKPGVWAAKIKQLAEGVPIPWPISIKHMDDAHGSVGRIGYSVVVEIHCSPVDAAWKAKSLEGV